MKKLFIFISLLFLTTLVSAYTDYGITDIVLPNVVREGEDFDATFLISSNQTGDVPVSVDVNIYTPLAGLAYHDSHSISTNDGLITINDADLNYSTQPYLLRARITTNDDNPSNDVYNKYFTVAKSSERIPVSDIPLFSGILVALLALFFVSEKKTKKKWLPLEKNDLICQKMLI